MASISDVLRRVADRHVARLIGPLEVALRQGRGRINESALANALASPTGLERAIRQAEAAIEDQDLRVLVAKVQMSERLLDIASDSSDATRCAVRPTGPGTSESGGVWPVNEDPSNRDLRLQRGYTEITRIDARAFARKFEESQGRELAWQARRTEALRDVPELDAYPQVTAFKRDGKIIIDVTDGRHRIALAAERNQLIDVSMTPESRKAFPKSLEARPAGRRRVRVPPTADAITQVAAEASEQSARTMVGTDTVPMTADIRRALDTTPLRPPTDVAPSPGLVRQSLEEAVRTAQFDATAPKVRLLSIADLKPTSPLTADSELVVRYRSNLPVGPIVVNADGVILDGHARSASAWAAGRDQIYAVQVASDEVGMTMEWLRWNN